MIDDIVRAEVAILVEVTAERRRAHAKHCATSMESCDALADRRLRILVEEVGEVAKALNDRDHADGFTSPNERDDDARRDVRAELVQVAAMAVAWIAAIDGFPLPPG